MNEAVVATIDNNALVLDSPEEKGLGKEVSEIELRVSAMQVTDDLGYAAAGSLLKQVKAMQKKVKEYWEPLRVSAKKAYDNVLAKKKEMTDPIDGAEKILKRKMGDYTMEQERKAREEEERRRREAQAEIDRKLEEAAKLESQGDKTGSDFAMAEAEVYDQYASGVSVQAQRPKVSGVSTSKTWKIKSIDPSKVPIFFNGVELRPVDTAAVLRMVKSSKGQISIPGVEIEEDVVTSVRV